MKQFWLLVTISQIAACVYSQHAQVCVDSAEARMRQGEYQIALRELSAAIAQDPKAKVLHYLSGKCRAALNDHYGAIADFTHAVEIDTMYALAYYGRALSRALRHCV